MPFGEASTNSAATLDSVERDCLFINDEGVQLVFVLALSSTKVSKELSSLIEGNLGLVKPLKEKGNYGAIFVDSENVSKFSSEVVFNVSYILDCIDEGEILNINLYRCSEAKHSPKLNYMDLFYFRKFTWGKIPEEFLLESDKEKRIIGDAQNVEEDERTQMSSDDDSVVTLHSEKNRLESDIEKRIIGDVQNVEEDERTQMSSDDDSVVTLHSEKNRLESDKEKRIIGDAQNVEEDKRTQVSLDNDDVETLYSCSVMSGESRKHSRLLFSTSEKQAIAAYILKENCVHLLKGNLLWKQMEAANICPIRTWQSMKNHFQKTMIYELHKFKFPDKFLKDLKSRFFQD